MVKTLSLGIISRLALCVSLAVVLYSYTSPAQQDSVGDHPNAATNDRRFDGPAELPRLHVRSAMSDTPAPGRTLFVKAGDDLQSAIDNAKCGDTVKLQAGVVFGGLYHFPKKPCDDSHWVIVRTSAPDSSLPPEGTRITPCYAGVASLPGRPDFHCSSPRNVLARIELTQEAWSGPILFSDGANHYRFIGLEITRALPKFHLRNLVQALDAKTSANHLIFDRLWLHGTAEDETKGGIHLSGTTYAAVIDSYFSNFQCIARKGSCTDAQAINGGTFDLPGGPYKIENNFLEASGQSIMFGGAAGSTTPADIEIFHNHLFKPILWRPGEPGFLGGYTGDPFIVKNNFELKNAQRVLFEGNILENSWGGFTQAGFSIVLTPANQGDHCPLCRVTDITLRYNKIIHVASGLLIANVAPKQQRPSSGGERYSIHDLLVEDIQGTALKGFGLFALMGSRVPPLKDVSFDHITAFPPRAILTITNPGEKVLGFSMTNSIFAAGDREMAGAAGGAKNCTAGFRRGDVSGILNSCFSKPNVSHNLIIGSFGKWPEHNTIVKDTKDAGLGKAPGDAGENYRVCPGKGGNGCTQASPASRAASDGKDIGADLTAVDNATRGVI